MFAQNLGVTRDVFKKYELGSEPGAAFLLQLSSFTGLSIEQWLTQDWSLSDSVPESIDKQLKVLPIVVDTSDREFITHVPIQASAGYAKGYSDPEFIAALPTYRLPGLSQGTYRSFEIKGDSMPPLQTGAIVVGKYVDHWKSLKNLQPYVIVTKSEGVVFKRVINKIREHNFLLCLSDNPIYQPFKIPAQEVEEVWEYSMFLQPGDPNPDKKLVYKQMLSSMQEGQDVFAEI